MQTLTDKKISNFNNQYFKTLSISDIEKFYLSGIKEELKIGLEYERLSLDKNTYKTAGYDKVGKIIEHFAVIKKWELIYDTDTIIGAKDNLGNSISLEPGCQLELSLSPKKDIEFIDMEATRIIELLDEIAKIYDVIFLGYGIAPVSTQDEIPVLNKRRYKIMNEYLPFCHKGELCPKMMRQTAGIQVNVDFKSKKDAYDKLKLFNLIMPFISGLCSNSPLEDNTVKEFKSIRNNVWRYTGEDRCNLFYKDIFKKKFFKYNNIFKNYINEILNVPMVFIEKNDEYIPVKGKINFRKYMKSGYNGYKADYSDYLTHQSLCFPDVRLKNYIEIRNHDSNSLDFALALCALYKGICIGNIEELINKLDFLNIDETDEYYRMSSYLGLDFYANKIEAWEIVKTIYDFSVKNLSSKDKIYIEPIKTLIEQRKTPADKLIDNNIKNTEDLIYFL